MIVIGTGLIGTSVALAARRAGVTVFLSDRDPAAVRVAEALGAGVAQEPRRCVDLAVLAVPPVAIGPVLHDVQTRRIALSYTDVASVKEEAERVALRSAPDPAAYVGGHPMAGRERSGPLAASADLFAGRPWVLTPSARTDRATTERAESLVGLCGGVPVLLASRAHDDVVALTSHLPHLVASLMAARLADGPPGTGRLAGRGVRDVTRIAAGDPTLWADIVRANAASIATVLRDLQADLARLVRGVEELTQPGAAGRTSGRRVVVDLLERGVAGVARTWPADGDSDTGEPGARLSVLVESKPGELARFLAAATAYGITADDVAVATATSDAIVLRVACPAGVVDHVAAGLRTAGWELAAADQ
jgi:prephenate dehydrogenase